MFRIAAFYRARRRSGRELADELDADRLAAAPDHFAAASGPGIARKRQPQFGRQRVGIVDRDLRPGRGHVLHHALARRKAAIERDPPGLAATICASRASWSIAKPCQKFPRPPALRHPALKTVAKYRRFAAIAGASARARNRRKKRFSGGLPTRPNATIRSPVAASMDMHGRRPTRHITRITH